MLNWCDFPPFSLESTDNRLEDSFYLSATEQGQSGVQPNINLHRYEYVSLSMCNAIILHHIVHPRSDEVSHPSPQDTVSLREASRIDGHDS